MATYIVSSAAELRTVLGYYDDSETEAVAGTAVARDIVVLSMNGTVDLGADDNILMPAAGVWIDGPGRSALTIQGRMSVVGAGGLTTVTRLSGWTLDIKGNVPLPSGAGTTYGACAIQDSSCYAEDFSVINSDTGDGKNNLTLVSSPDKAAIRCVLVDCLFDSANLDCLSTKGIDGTANSSSVAECYRCVGKNPGAGAIDQAFTAHDGFAMHLYGCYAEGGTSKVAIQSSNTIMDIVNCQIKGAVLDVRTISGCVIDRNALSDTICRLRPDSTIEHTRVLGTNAAVLTHGGIELAETTGTTVVRYCEITGSVNTAMAAIRTETGNETPPVCEIDHCLFRTCYRGPDLRKGTGHKLENSLITDASNYSFLYTNTTTNLLSVSGTKVSSNEYPDEGIITPAAIDAGEIAALAAAIKPYQQTMPRWEDARNSLLAYGGWVRRRLLIGRLLPL